MRFGEHLRLRSVLSGVTEPYRYEKEVEDFLRWSPSVRNRDPRQSASRWCRAQAERRVPP